MRRTHRSDCRNMRQKSEQVGRITVAIIISFLITGSVNAALSGTRTTNDLVQMYLPDDVLNSANGWVSVATAGVDFHKNSEGNLEYTTTTTSGGRWLEQSGSSTYFVSNVGSNTSFTFEVSIKMQDAATAGTHISYIWIENAGGQGTVFEVRDTGTNLAGDTTSDNTDTFHKFRVAFDAVDDLFYFWRDGILLGTSSPTNPGGGQRIIIGDGSSSIKSGTVQYEYVATDATGAYEPDTSVPYCGQAGTEYLFGDLNRDCYVDLEDVAIMAENWLGCTDVFVTECQENL